MTQQEKLADPTAAQQNSLQVLRDGLEFLHHVHFFVAIRQAVADVIVDQRLLRRVDGALDRLQLLRQFHAGPFRFQHLDDAGKVAVRAFEAFDDRRM